jgi:hypothetical protein
MERFSKFLVTVATMIVLKLQEFTTISHLKQTLLFSNKNKIY